MDRRVVERVGSPQVGLDTGRTWCTVLCGSGMRDYREEEREGDVLPRRLATAASIRRERRRGHFERERVVTLSSVLHNRRKISPP
jgi:hypothetical protein